MRGLRFGALRNYKGCLTACEVRQPAKFGSVPEEGMALVAMPRCRANYTNDTSCRKVAWCRIADSGYYYCLMHTKLLVGDTGICSVCFNDFHHEWQQLPSQNVCLSVCGHVLCKSCDTNIRRVADANANGRRRADVTCPTCRKKWRTITRRPRNAVVNVCFGVRRGFVAHSSLVHLSHLSHLSHLFHPQTLRNMFARRPLMTPRRWAARTPRTRMSTWAWTRSTLPLLLVCSRPRSRSVRAVTCVPSKCDKCTSAKCDKCMCADTFLPSNCDKCASKM